MTSNNIESVNALTKDVQKLPITTLMDWFRDLLQKWYYERRAMHQGTSSSTPAISSDVAELKDMVKALLLDKKNQSPTPTPSTTPALVKAVNQALVYQAPIPQTQRVSQMDFERYVKANDAILRNMQSQGQLYRPQVNQALVYQAPIPQTQRVSQMDFERYVKANDAILRNMQSQGTLPGNTVTNPKKDLKGITTRSGVAYPGPKTHSQSKQGTKVTKDQVQTSSSQDTAPVQPSVIQSESQAPVSVPVVAPVSAPMPNLKPSIPYPSRRDNEKRRDQANEQIKKFCEIFKDISFEISFTDAQTLIPKFASTLKALIENKEKLNEMARTPMNEHCSAVILNKLPRKLGDPEKFLIPCEFPGMDECLALEDLGASINLMPFSMWEALLLLELTPTCMTLELADRSVSKPISIAKDVSFKVGVFQFPADFVVVDFEPDLRVPLILERCFLKTSRALIDVHKTDAFLGLEDDPDSPKIIPFYYDPEGDILLLKAILNSEPSPPLCSHEQYFPSYKKELKVCKAKTVKSSVDEPPEVELKDLPPHLEYAFSEGDNKLPVIIAKELGDEEKSALIKVLKSHKRAIAWKLSDIQDINLKFCTHKILMEED
nr:reverse transcriptase domain-containing protein [Tanacetum cinerariifolium]